MGIVLNKKITPRGVVVVMCVCVLISSKKKCIPKSYSRCTGNAHTEHVLNTLDGWRFSESDRKNVILGGDDGGGGGVGGSRRGGGR